MIQGKKIWDITCIPDREEFRIELTDLIRFRGNWYCGFREGEIHGNHPSGRARIIRSSDGEDWESVALLDWDSADVREPKLSVTAEGKLLVNTSLYFTSKQPRTDGNYYQLNGPGTPQSDSEADVARQSVTWLSSDGVDWSSAYACPSGVNSWRWEVVWHNGMGYSVGYGGRDQKGTLYRTRDGKSWQVLLDEFFPEGKGSEATLAFAEDTVYCLLRYSAERTMVGIGKAPCYQEWEWRDIGVDCGPEHGGLQPARDVFRVHFGGPRLIRLTEGRLVAAARMLWPWRDDGKITLFLVDPETAVLTVFAEIDGTSYAGLVEHEGELWVSCVGSDWETDMGIVLAKVGVPG